MRKSKAKERILQTAEDAIREKGYSSLNVNDIAYLAKVSIGTLYYHFPDGKASILAEILSRMQQRSFESGGPLLESLDIRQGDGFDDVLGKILLVVINERRKDRYFLAATQAEMLADLSQYKDTMELYESHGTMQHGWKIFVGLIARLTEQFPDSAIDIKGHETRIERAIGTLMTYQIMFPGYLGDDNEFAKMLVKIIRVIIRRES